MLAALLALLLLPTPGAGDRKEPVPPRDLSLLIDISDHELRVMADGVVVATHPVALGDGVGDKVQEGDHRTPRGTFRVVTRNDRSQFHRFLGLSYPTAEDADRGLTAGLITPAQAQAIRAAEEAGRQPPWNTPLGGAVGIHGGGIGSDWTYGCIALTNEDIDALWEVVRIGTPVTIQE